MAGKFFLALYVFLKMSFYFFSTASRILPLLSVGKYTTVFIFDKHYLKKNKKILFYLFKEFLLFFPLKNLANMNVTKTICLQKKLPYS